MPNHITNRLVIEGDKEEVAKVFDFLKADKPNEDCEIALVDFNKIIQMPEDLDVSSSTEGEDGQKYLLGMGGNVLEVHRYKQSEHYAKMVEMQEKNLNRFNACLDLGRRYLHNVANYGCTTWYEWRCRHWGTKWNAYEINKEADNIITFQTAWSGVPDLISRLGAMFPNVIIKYDYADENISCNVGSYIIDGDTVCDNSPEDETPEAWKIVFDLGVADIDDYVELPDGTYEYKEED